MSKSESEARLNVTQKAIEKEFGHVVKWLGEAALVEREVISTGCLGLDNAIGNGGLERGLIAEFFGESGGGKSFLGYSVIKQACDLGNKCAIVDAENSLDARLLVKVGLGPDQVMIVDGAPTGEANLSIADKLMQTGDFAVVMIDSVAALVPDARTEHDYDQQTMGLHARMMSAGIQKILPVAKRSNTLLLFINQTRNKIGGYGNPKTTTGGEALPFYASYRIEVIGSPKSSSRRLQDEGTGELYGHKTTFRVVKNKRSAPYREAEVDLIYGVGYDTVGELLDLGVDIGVVGKSGNWLTFEDQKWQGKAKAKLSLMSNETLAARLSVAARALIGGEIIAPAVEPEEVPDDKPVSKKRTRES
jgi:recombination protein RecA